MESGEEERYALKMSNQRYKLTEIGYFSGFLPLPRVGSDWQSLHLVPLPDQAFFAVSLQLSRFSCANAAKLLQLAAVLCLTCKLIIREASL